MHDPVGWAEAYYARYPALTVLFYPPLLHVVLAMFFAIFGVSHFVAMLAISLFYLAMLIGVFKLGEQLTNIHGGLALALLFGGAPEVAIWGRQVMLEIPMMAFAVWSAYFVLRHLDSNQNRDLFRAGFLALCAVYTKQTVIFILPVFLAVVLAFRWREFLANKRAQGLVLLTIVGLLPLIVMQLKFAAFNLTSVSHRADIGVSKWSLDGWLWYLLTLPKTIGWPATALVILSPLAVFRLPLKTRTRQAFLLIAGWTLFAFLFFNIISLKETRHGIPLYFGFVALGVYAAYHLFPARLATGLTLSLGVITVVSTWILVPNPVLSGYQTAANAVIELAKPDARVMFVGNRDGHFIFNTRANPHRGNIAVVRADKLLLNIKVMPSLGYGAKDFDQAAIGDMLNRYGIEWVVAVEDFWTHIPVMKELDQLLNSHRFEVIKRIPITAVNLAHKDKVLVIYRNLGELHVPPDDYAIQLGAIDHKIEKAR